MKQQYFIVGLLFNISTTIIAMKQLDCREQNIESLIKKSRNQNKFINKIVQERDDEYIGNQLSLSKKKLASLDGIHALAKMIKKKKKTKSITDIDLAHNAIKSIDSKSKPFKKFDKTTHLSIAYNILIQLPQNIFNDLKNLMKLDLSYNKLLCVPKKIGDLQNLQHLDLSNNKIVTLPKTIGKLKALIDCYLENNQLSSLPYEMKNLQNVETVDLSNNKLNRTIKWLGYLKNLDYLDLNNNELPSLPQKIAKLKKLETLYLKNNKLSYLPEDIEDLKYLTYLDLSGNKFNDKQKEKIQGYFPESRLKVCF